MTKALFMERSIVREPGIILLQHGTAEEEIQRQRELTEKHLWELLSGRYPDEVIRKKVQEIMHSLFFIEDDITPEEENILRKGAGVEEISMMVSKARERRREILRGY